MNVALLQTDIRWNAPEENIVGAERLMERAGEAELYVLPEMWNTGFVTNVPAAGHETALEWMRETARKRNAAVCGSMAVRLENEVCVNRLFFVKPDGETDYYDKHHLFKYGGEDRYFTAGDRRTVVTWRGMRFLLTVCYDMRFPVWLRYRGDYDAIICVANWPDSRHTVWQTLLRARAIENQCYVMGCNRVGDDPNCHYVGHSAVTDTRGLAIVEDKTEREAVIETEVSGERLRIVREKFRVLDDRDAFEMK